MKSASDDGVIVDWGKVENVFNPAIVSSPVFITAFASKYALVMKSASDDGVIVDWGKVENVFNPAIVSSPVFITAPAAATSAAVGPLPSNSISLTNKRPLTFRSPPLPIVRC